MQTDRLPAVTLLSGRMQAEIIRRNCAKQETRKAIQRLRRKRFQTGTVRLREDRGPAYWQGRYQEDVVTEIGEIVRKRRSINLGYWEEVCSEKAARQKLAVILDPINAVDRCPKKLITFRSFIDKYRSLKLANKKERLCMAMKLISACIISLHLVRCGCRLFLSNRCRHSSTRSLLRARQFRQSRILNGD